MRSDPGGKPSRTFDAAHRRVGGAAIVLVAALPAGLALALALVGGIDPSDIVRLLVTAVVYAPVAAVALHLRRSDIVTITAALAITSGWLALLIMLQRQHPDVLPLEALQITAAHVARLPELAALAVLPWLLVRERGRPHHGGVVFGAGALVLSAAVSLAGIAAALPSALVIAPLVWAIASFVVSATVLGRRWRGAGERARTALVWFTVGVCLLVASYARVLVPLRGPGGMLADAVFVLAQGLLPLGILAGIVATDRVRVERRTVQALAAAQALAFAIAAYLAAIAASSLLGIGPAVTGAVAAATLALVLGGTIRAVRGRLERVLSDPAPDARAVLARVGQSLSDDTVPGGLQSIADALRQTWRLSSVEITAGSSSARIGTPEAETIETALACGGRSIGTLTVTGGTAFSLDTEVRPVLQQTAGLIAVAVALATVNDDVAATRRRTLDVRREERRVLHDELHDRLAPALAGISFGMSAAAGLVAAVDARAADVLAELREHVGDCTEDVRQLARTLLPTALDQGDLEGALAELAGHISSDALDVRIEAHATDALDPDVQLRLYLMLADVLTLARRTGGLRRIVVFVIVEADVVRTRLRVDEPFAPGTAIALGEALRRRADELGARSSSHGTCIFEAVIAR